MENTYSAEGAEDKKGKVMKMEFSVEGIVKKFANPFEGWQTTASLFIEYYCKLAYTLYPPIWVQVTSYTVFPLITIHRIADGISN